MITIFYYYLYKIINIFFSILVSNLFLEKIFFQKGIFISKKNNFSFQGKIVFAFWDKNCVHLGDQLFHQPIIKFLNQKYEVYICTYSDLTEYFLSQNLKTLSFQELKSKNLEGAIFISKHDMLYKVFRNFSSSYAFIGLNYAKLDGEDKIIITVAKVILGAFFKLRIFDNPDKFLKSINFEAYIPENIVNKYRQEKVLKLFLENPDKKFFIFNDRVASNYIGTIFKKLFFRQLIKKKRKEGYKVVYVSEKERGILSNLIIGKVDFDLSKKFNSCSLFALFALTNIEGVISFDTYIAHIASIFKKELYIVLRKRNKNELFKKRFIPMFPNFDYLLKLCL